MKPILSRHFATRQPSAIRVAQMTFSQRNDEVTAVNTAIGNVSLPMHPAMCERLFHLNDTNSPFHEGVVKYSPTVGFEETNHAFLTIIAASGFNTDGLYSQITDGGSQAMELVVLGTAGAAGSDERPLLLIDAAYTNYSAMAKRLGRTTISIHRSFEADGTFSLPPLAEIDQLMERYHPGALVVIPYDNPTGQFLDLTTLKTLAGLCVKHNCWMISDEAYRELYYTKDMVSSIWGVIEADVPGIQGRRVSIESTSKVWNACGLRIGALITDNLEYHQKSVAENTANLCSSVIGQYIFGAIAHESIPSLQTWFSKQRTYYFTMINEVTKAFTTLMPKLIISQPDASIYSVVDVRHMVPSDFDANDFVFYCASKGKVLIDGTHYTLLVSPMAEFYSVAPDQPNPGKTQMRIAYVESPETMRMVPYLFKTLLDQYLLA